MSASEPSFVMGSLNHGEEILGFYEMELWALHVAIVRKIERGEKPEEERVQIDEVCEKISALRRRLYSHAYPDHAREIEEQIAQGVDLNRQMAELQFAFNATQYAVLQTIYHGGSFEEAAEQFWGPLGPLGSRPANGRHRLSTGRFHRTLRVTQSCG